MLLACVIRAHRESRANIQGRVSMVAGSFDLSGESLLMLFGGVSVRKVDGETAAEATSACA